MMTPNDIQSKRFDKGMGGYKVEEVHSYLGEVSEYVEDLLAERAELEGKLEILAEKLEEYREDEDSLRAALISAQKLGDSVVRESKSKAEAILAEATHKSEELITRAKNSIDKESAALRRMQDEVAKFKGQILMMYQRHIEMIQLIPYGPNLAEVEVEPAKPAVVAVEPRETKPRETQPKDNETFNIRFEAAPEQSEDTEEFPKAKASKYGTLRFGEEFKLERKE